MSIQLAKQLGYATIEDAGFSLNPQAARLLPEKAQAVAIQLSGNMLQVVTPDIPSPADVAAWEKYSGCSVAVAVAPEHVFVAIKARARTSNGNPAELHVALSALPSEVTQVRFLPGQPPLVHTPQGVSVLPDAPPLTIAAIDELTQWCLGKSSYNDIVWGGVTWKAAASLAAGGPTLAWSKSSTFDGTLATLGLPASLNGVDATQPGLLLIASPSQQGKSSTAEALAKKFVTSHNTWMTRVTSRPNTISSSLGTVHQQLGVDTLSVKDALNDDVLSTPVVLIDAPTYSFEDVQAICATALAGYTTLVCVPANSLTNAITHLLLPVPQNHRDGVLAAFAATWQLGLAQQLKSTAQGVLRPVTEVWWRNPTLASTLRHGELTALSGISPDGLQPHQQGQHMHSALQSAISSGTVVA